MICILRKADPATGVWACVWDPQLSIHAGEMPRNKCHPCWTCLVHNLCFNSGFHQQILGLSYNYFISGKPVDVSMYFMNQCQRTSKVLRLKFSKLIQYGNFAFSQRRNNQKRLKDPDVQFCTDAIELKDKIAKLDFAAGLLCPRQVTSNYIWFQGRLWRGVSHNIRQCNAAFTLQNSSPESQGQTRTLENEAVKPLFCEQFLLKTCKQYKGYCVPVSAKSGRNQIPVGLARTRYHRWSTAPFCSSQELLRSDALESPIFWNTEERF